MTTSGKEARAGRIWRRRSVPQSIGVVGAGGRQADGQVGGARVLARVWQRVGRGLMGSKAEVTLEIQADVQRGVFDNAVRTITENCRALKFKAHVFEKE